MDLRAHLLELVAPVEIGGRLGTAVLRDASTELGLRLSFEVDGMPVHIEVAPLEEGAPHAARSARLTFAYRAGCEDARVDGEVGLALCRAVAEAAARNEERVLARLGDPDLSHPGGEGKVREVRVARLLERAGGIERPYFTLSPYVGCLIGCRFCYAQSSVGQVRRWMRLPQVPWGSYVDVRVNAPEVLAQELADAPVRPIKFCPIVSDPYQAIEKRYTLTRQCLEVLVEAEPRPVFVLTRSALIERDVDVLARLPGARVGVSLPTIDDEVRAHFEPRGASVAGRVAVLQAMKAAGVATFAVVQPLLPGSLDQLADTLAGAVQSVSIDILQGEYGASADFADPRYAHCRDQSWQIERATALKALLEQRSVSVWDGELPPLY